MAIPLLALVVTATMSSGGIESTLVTLEQTVRQTFTSVVEFVSRLF